VLVYEQGTSNQSVVAYDLGRARRVWNLPRKLTADLAISDVAVAADGIVIAMPEAVFYQDFDGSPLEKLFDGEPDWESIVSVSVAPDGVTLAVSVSVPAVPFGTPTASGQTYRFTGRIVFYDLEKRVEIREVAGAGENSLGAGRIQWRDDDRGVVLRSSTNSHRPPPSTGVFLDGRVVAYDVDSYSYLGPNGRKTAHGIEEQDCLSLGSHDIYVRDFDTGSDIAEFHDEQRLFYGLDWSPDGTEFLLASRPYTGTPSCQQTADPYVELLWNITTGTRSTVTDLQAIYGRWYGDDLVWLACDGRFEPLVAATYGTPYAYCEDEESKQTEGTLRYRNVEIDRSTYFRVLGITEGSSQP
jgi:WD40 repeat protein